MSLKKFGAVILITGLLTGGGVFMMTSGQLSELQPDSKSDEYTAGPTNTSITVSSPSNSSVQLDVLTRPDGIGESSVSEDRLFESHREALESVTFTSKYNETVKSGVVDTSLSTRVVRHGTNETVIRTDRGKQEVVEWSNGSVAYKRGYGGDGERIFEARGPSSESKMMFYHEVKRLITAVNYEVVGVANLHGEPMFVLESQKVTAPASISELLVGEMTEFNATVYVSESGVIHQIRYQAESSSQGRSITQNGVMEVSAVNDTVVNEPKWVSSASEDAVRLNRSVTDNALVMAMENGETIPSGSTITVQNADGEKFERKLSQDLKEGDTLYLAASTESGLVVSVNEEPTGNTKTFRRAFVTIKKDGIVYRTAVGFGRPSQ